MESTSIDDDLMKRVRMGSREAFLQLIRRWQGRLLRFFLLLGADWHAAEDCVQETFLRVFRYRSRFRPMGKGFRTLLFRIGRNVSADYHRKRRRTEVVIPFPAALEGELRIEDPVQVWNESLDARTAVRSLPDRLRAVVILNIYEGLSYREIAEVLGIPRGTVKSRMHHALARIREVLRVEVRS